MERMGEERRGVQGRRIGIVTTGGMRPGGPPRGGARATALWLGAAVVAVGALGLWSLAARPPAGRSLEPLRTSTDPRTGEQVAAFSGFAVAIDTEPPGAQVLIDGVERGEAPVLAGVDCGPGEEVEIRAAQRGAGEASAVTTCRPDTLVKLTLRLRR
jgi:hypothetical protein